MRFDTLAHLCHIEAMNIDGLYNKACGLPPGAASFWSGRLQLDYAKHAQSKSLG